MKIAIVTATFPPYRGGTGHVAFYHARGLSERGHDVTVFTAQNGNGSETLEFEFRVEYLRRWFRMGNAPLTPALAWKIRGFDIVHVHQPYIFGAELAQWCASRTNTPVVVSYHNDLVAPGAKGMAFNWYSRHVQERLLREATLIAATSDDYAQHSRLSEMLRLRKIEVLANGVDCSKFVPGPGACPREIPSGAPWAMFVGALDQAHFFKGLDVLLDAMVHLPDWHLVVVGNGELRTRYEAHARQIGIASRVHWQGGTPDESLVGLYQAATVTVLPSVTQGEAFGLVLLESMACGTPVVASNLPGVRSVVPESSGLSRLVTPGSVTLLARAIGQLGEQSTPNTRSAVREWVKQNFSWDRVLSDLEDCYARAVQISLDRTLAGRAL